MAAPELSGRAVAAGAVALAVVGVILIFGGRGDDDVTAGDGGDPSSTGSVPSTPPESVWSPFGRDATPSWSSVPDGSPQPTPQVTPTSVPTWEPTPVPTSATAPPTDPPVDPHVHEPPTLEEIENAPPPNFDHFFRTDVSDELADTIIATAWPWVVQRLESEAWTHVELIEYGVEETAAKNSAAVVEMGYQGVDGLGAVGVGKIVTVWLELEADGSWMVVGFRNGALREEE